MTTSVADVARYLEEAGLLDVLVAAPGRDPASIILDGVSTNAAAGPGDLAWSRDAVAAGFRGSLLLCPPPAPAAADLARGSAVAVCPAPRLSMAEVLTRFFAHLEHDSEPVYADPGLATVVAENGSWVWNATVGYRVRLAAHVVIGCGGMGYERTPDGRLVRFPQVGSVRVEDDVDIAAHATVQRGTLGDTVVRRGAKIGPCVNVGHNVEVGEHVLIAGNAQIGGGTRIGPGATIWQSAVVANGVTIGEGAVVGMAAALRKDVGPGEVWAGNPARRLR